MLKPDEAARSLEDVEVIPYAEVALAYGKELLQTWFCICGSKATAS